MYFFTSLKKDYLDKEKISILNHYEKAVTLSLFTDSDYF